MANIRVTTEILAGNLGMDDHQNEAAHSLAEYTHKTWHEDLKPLEDRGHEVEVIVLIREDTSGYRRPIDIIAYDGDELDGTLKREVEDSLTPENDIWEQWLQSAEAAKLAA